MCKIPGLSCDLFFSIDISGQALAESAEQEPELWSVAGNGCGCTFCMFPWNLLTDCRKTSNFFLFLSIAVGWANSRNGNLHLPRFRKPSCPLGLDAPPSLQRHVFGPWSRVSIAESHISNSDLGRSSTLFFQGVIDMVDNFQGH